MNGRLGNSRTGSSVLALAAGLVLAGCATVHSSNVDFPRGGVAVSGQQPPAPANAGRADDSTKTGSGIAEGLTYFLPRQLVRVSFTQIAKDLDKAVDKLAKSRAAAASAQATLDGLTDTIALLKAQIDATPSGTPGRDALVGALGKAVGQQQIVKGEVDSNDAAVKANTATAIAAAGSTDPTPALKVELLAPSADPARRFVLSPSHNAFRDDTQHYAVSSDGLLSSANVVAVDRTGDILVEIGGDIAQIFLPVPHVGPAVVPKHDRPQAESAACPAKARDWSFIFDPVDQGLGQVNDKLRCLGLQLVASPTIVGSGPLRDRGALNASAIYYRTAIPIVLTLEKFYKDGETITALPLQSISLTLPQAGPISRLPMRASAFVKTTSTIGFDKGMVVDWSSDRPSEVLQAAQVPFKIVERAFGAASQLVQFKVDLGSKQASLANGQAALANSEAARAIADAKTRALLDCIAAARRDASDATACGKE